MQAVDDMGFETPTEVQSVVIPQILNRKDLIVMAKTGSGKTAAFGIPILQLMDRTVKGPQCLILTPTRELAVQVDSDIKLLSKHMELSTTAVYGQHSINTEVAEMNKGASVITGTPGRVFDHINRKHLKTGTIKFVVLDEADRMLDMGFIDQVVKIIKTIPRDRVTLLFSATMPPAIKRICQSYMNNPKTIELGTDTKTVDSIKQIYYRAEGNDKKNQLDRLLRYHQPESCMVFCNMRVDVDRVNQYLEKKGYYTEAIHGMKTQSNRMRTIDQFKTSKVQVMVATDVAARGIHIDDLSIVINYNVPVEKDSYIHRIGRTGRAGNGGLAISLVSSEEIMSLYELEEHVGALIEEVSLPTDEEVEASVNNNAEGKWIEPKPFSERRTKSEYVKRDSHQRGGRNASGSRNKGQDSRSNQKPKPYGNKAGIKHVSKPIVKEHVKQVAKHALKDATNMPQKQHNKPVVKHVQKDALKETYKQLKDQGDKKVNKPVNTLANKPASKPANKPVNTNKKAGIPQEYKLSAKQKKRIAESAAKKSGNHDTAKTQNNATNKKSFGSVLGSVFKGKK